MLQKLKIIILASLLIFILKPVDIYALGPFNIDIHASAGSGSARFENKTAGKPVTYQYGLGTTLGYSFVPLLYLGASFDYLKMVQITDISNEWGNRKGTRLNYLSPTVGLKFLNLHLKLDYQLLGKYTLDLKDTGGNEISYESPKGYRAYLGYRVFTTSEIGGFYEKLLYGKEVKGTTKTTLADKQKMEVKQIGLMYLLSF